MQAIRNFAILAHVDAGKTTLAERILFNAGEVRHPGNVDDGLATLDYLPEEKERGITIEAGVASYLWKDCWFNILDTPGHIDFGAEVDLALDAVEGAVLVISGTGGVETQTLEAWRKLRSRNVLTLLFINKLDHADSRPDEILLELEELLQVRPLLLNLPYFVDGKISAMFDVATGSFMEHDERGREIPSVQQSKEFPEAGLLRRELVEAASTVDDAILESALANHAVEAGTLLGGLKNLFNKGQFVPCFCGSALRNRGVRQLMTGLGMFLPQAVPKVANLGQVVRIRYARGHGEVALFKAALNRSRSQWPAGFEFRRVRGDLLLPLDHVRSGDLYALQVQGRHLTTGEIIGKHGEHVGWAHGKHIYTPLVQTRLECVHSLQWQQVDAALQVLVRSDPSLRLEREPASGSWILRTVGEVHLDVAVARLRREFQCEIRHGKPQVDRFEILRIPQGPWQNSYTTKTGSLEISLSLITCEDFAPALVWQCPLPTEILQRVCAEACAEFLHGGILGTGPLRRAQVLLHSWQAQGTILPGLAKKCLSDGLRLHVQPDHICSMEPWVQLQIYCPDEHVGVVLGDLQSRGAEIGEWTGDGKFCKIFALAPLEKVFGYSIIVRSISKGTASYALRYERHREVASGR